MPRRKLLPEPDPIPSARRRLTWYLMRHWLWPFVAVLVVAIGLFAGLLALESCARARIVDNQRYQVDFADIECVPPPGMTREEFLDEVQYYDRSAPPHFSLVEPNLEAKLIASFRRHPWVNEAAVELKRPNMVRVVLTLRQPVLAVAVPKSRTLRALDSTGMVLPKKVPVPGDIVVLEKAPPTKNPEGQKWGDPLVEYAAQTMRCLDSHPLNALHEFRLTRMEWTPDGLVLFGQGMKVLWGKGEPSEAEKSVKVQRVLALGPQRKVLAGWLPLALEIDVRRPEAVSSRLVLRERP
jgi:hypothetical protein